METNTKTNKNTPVKFKVNFADLKKELAKNKMLVTALVVVLFLGLLYFVKSLFIVALVNGMPVTRIAVIEQLEKAQGKAALESLVTKTLVQQEANKKGVKVSKEDIDKELVSIENSLKAQNQDLDTVLEAQGMTRAQLLEQIKYQKTVEKLLGDKVNVTDDEVTAYIANNKESMPTESTDQVKDIVKQQLEQQKLSTEYQKLVTDLKSNSKVTYFINY
jgi:foldase protein PrsA